MDLQKSKQHFFSIAEAMFDNPSAPKDADFVRNNDDSYRIYFDGKYCWEIQREEVLSGSGWEYSFSEPFSPDQFEETGYEVAAKLFENAIIPPAQPDKFDEAMSRATEYIKKDIINRHRLGEQVKQAANAGHYDKLARLIKMRDKFTARINHADILLRSIGMGDASKEAGKQANKEIENE